MDAQDFASSLATLLRLCRMVADQALPIEGMLAHVEEQRVQVRQKSAGGAGAALEELDALELIIQAVGDVAAIGARLRAEPEEPKLIQVPSPPGGAFPLPSNVGG